MTREVTGDAILTKVQTIAHGIAVDGLLNQGLTLSRYERTLSILSQACLGVSLGLNLNSGT